MPTKSGSLHDNRSVIGKSDTPRPDWEPRWLWLRAVNFVSGDIVTAKHGFTRGMLESMADRLEQVAREMRTAAAGLPDEAERGSGRKSSTT